MSTRSVLRKTLVAVVGVGVVAAISVASLAGTANATPARTVDCQAMEQIHGDADHFGAVAVQEQDFAEAYHWYAMGSATKANHDRLCAVP